MSVRSLGMVLVAMVVGFGCHSTSRREGRFEPADLRVVARDGSLEAPDSIAAGWTRLRVEEPEGGHIVVLFRVDGVEPASLPAYLTTLDTAAATPGPGMALGGPEIGDSGEVLIELKPGRYLLGCVRRGEDGHRHLAGGEFATLTVTEGRPGNPPVSTVELALTDFAFAGPDRWRAGPQLLRVTGGGRTDHQVRIARLRPGSTLKSWFEAEEPGDHADPVTGMARLGPGQVAVLPVNLTPGSYVLSCLVADPSTGRVHAELGMVRLIIVE